ncbi:hypothetical protein KIN20_001089 [Parelaphostrongylus tenuis]|uniref:Uncharacterized protein n=1 Tax=Parelaphostrongylus tenuis TaxID=148309 RepID=A0AAD5QE98_PARTN|nr:hypothetical protein KIN20_001089 [Parelaphostrongylus tenuis]
MADEDHQDSDGDRGELSAESDSESELDAAEYDRRREQCFRQIIMSEIQFNKLKCHLRDMKIKQLMKRRRDVLNQTDPEFMVKHRELLDEFNSRNKVSVRSPSSEESDWCESIVQILEGLPLERDDRSVLSG